MLQATIYWEIDVDLLTFHACSFFFGFIQQCYEQCKKGTRTIENLWGSSIVDGELLWKFLEINLIYRDEYQGLTI